MTEVVVENEVGPRNGYYHDPETGTEFGRMTMERSEAEERGYSRCRSCFPDEMTDNDGGRDS